VKFFSFCVVLAMLWPLAAQAAFACKGGDLPCLLNALEQDTAAIPETAWRDSTYRELAKLLARQGQEDRATALIGKIKTPDTRAITIRGIGMAAAQFAKLTKPQYDVLFAHLTAEANKIGDEASQAVALNYIAESQAAAGDDAGSLKTALAMKNQEMRNKALYDSSKAQAAAGRLNAAAIGIAAIDQPAFRDKARRTASKIRADARDYDGALAISGPIENPYQKAQAVLYILVRQISPEEVSIE
jgi:hypothetical protein